MSFVAVDCAIKPLLPIPLRTKVYKLTSYKYSSSKMATSSNSATGKKSASSQPGAMSSSYSSGHSRQSKTSLTTFSSPPTKPVETRYVFV